MDFQSAKSFGKLRLRAFQPYHLYYICQHCRYKTRISNAFNAIYVDTVDTKHMSRLRACGPVIPGIPRLAGVDPARYASGRYGDQVRYGDGILFLFVGGLMH